ncbi:DUF1803 domain-containing protein [Pseudolactococcus reticulitermitis]|uniref:DUF1803 domain-containing protein n=1 Tax=Pseudolactococcus reticulitermitis TaxID=2025039 RepID=A0A224X553_9LACT|nr:DUF1803 domain-containing protein [Lactococcus reticulitermitis]GAX47766.1 hypothetical protein RsY01_1369 [Lactococcus reticulitermitis]
MPIKIFNHNRLTQRPFFQELIDLLANHEDVTLRKIKATFGDEPNLERQIEDFVQAGLISRVDKRYTNQFQVFTDADFDLTLPETAPQQLVFDQPFFVAAGSELISKIQTSQVQQTLRNQTNGITLHFSSDYARKTENLANYFYHVEKRVALTPFEEKIFKLIGDVNLDYALKYMTTFLLKFAKKDVVKQKRPDIFVKTLETYGYIVKNGDDEESYRFNLTFDDREFEEIVFNDAQDFIAAQIRQCEALPIFVKLG